MCKTFVLLFKCGHIQHDHSHCLIYPLPCRFSISGSIRSASSSNMTCDGCKILGTEEYMRARVHGEYFLGIARAYEDIQARTGKAFIKRILLRLNYTFNLCKADPEQAFLMGERLSIEQATAVRDARMELWSTLIPRLSSRFHFEYSEKDVNFTLLPPYQSLLAGVLDTLTFHPERAALELYVFEERQGANPLRLEALPKHSRECAICREKYNMSYAHLSVGTRYEKENSWTPTSIMSHTSVLEAAAGQETINCSPFQLVPCKHIMCRACLGKWFLKETTCPFCRQSYRPTILESLLRRSEDLTIEADKTEDAVDTVRQGGHGCREIDFLESALSALGLEWDELGFLTASVNSRK
jgi:hypothetical protein